MSIYFQFLVGMYIVFLWLYIGFISSTVQMLPRVLKDQNNHDKLLFSYLLGSL